MKEPGNCNHGGPSPEALVGITVTLGDAEPPQERGPSQQGAATAAEPATGRPRAEDLVGITLTFEDSAGDARPGNLAGQTPAPPSQPRPQKPG